MTSNKERRGSFKDLRASDLLLFDPALHRHDRGWPHPPPAPSRGRSRRQWNTVGIFHFRHDDEDEEEGAGGNAGHC